MTAAENKNSSGSGRIPPYVQHLWLLIVAGLFHYFVVQSVALFSIEVPWGLVTLFLFPLAVFVGSYMGLAVTLYRKAVDAIDLMTSTVDTIGMLISGCSGETKTKVLRTFKELLKNVHRSLKGAAESDVYDLVLSNFRKQLVKADLIGSLVNGNGGMNRFMLARAQMKSIVSVRMSASLKWACVAMLVLTATFLALHLRGSGLPAIVQAFAFGGFCYVVWVMIEVANDLGQPF